MSSSFFAYVAGASGLPFAVLRAYNGTDLPKFNPHIKTIRCPFTEEQLAAVPAILWTIFLCSER